MTQAKGILKNFKTRSLSSKGVLCNDQRCFFIDVSGLNPLSSQTLDNGFKPETPYKTILKMGVRPKRHIKQS